MMTNLIDDDCALVLNRTRDLWAKLKSSRLFFTGATGFFGHWLLTTFTRANREFRLKARAVVLSRDPASFKRRRPHLAEADGLSIVPGDVRSFAFPEGEFTHVVHGAAISSVPLEKQAPLEVMDTIIQGTRRTLDFAQARRAGDVLFISSGAVYGRQPPDLTHIPEDYTGAPDPADPRSAYGEAKRAAELLCVLYGTNTEIRPKIARCFAFIGPYLPLDGYYAAGNFVRDSIRGGPILVNGDGRPYRSYLYASDLAVWLWTILLHGKTGRIYNVGSPEAVTIAQFAREIASLAGEIQVVINGESSSRKLPERYVPLVSRAHAELGLEVTVSRKQAIARTLEWARNHYSVKNPAGLAGLGGSTL